MNRKMIGEAIYIRVNNRKYNPIATKRGNVPTQSWRGKSAVFRIYSALTSHGYSKSIKAVRRQRNIGLTKEMHAVFLQSLGQYLRFLLRRPSVELAFLVTLVMCVVYLRSSDLCSPRYGLFCTCCRM